MSYGDVLFFVLFAVCLLAALGIGYYIGRGSLIQTPSDPTPSNKRNKRNAHSGIKRGVHHADDEVMRTYVLERTERQKKYASRHPYANSEVLNGERD